MNYFIKSAGSLSGTFLFICLFSFCTKQTSSGGGTTQPPVIAPPVVTDTATYQLVWSDEFDSTAVNTNTWNFETGGNGWGNNEQEYYTPGNNATIENGNLVITAKNEAMGGKSYTSSRMTTQGKKEFTYGKIEARLKMPVGQGLWPAFWMLGANINTTPWPSCGETDIMEHINADSTVYGTIHWNNNGHQQNGGNTQSSPTGYHVYGIEWTRTSISWYIDSTIYFTSGLGDAGQNAFANPSFILLNLAVGGNWPGQTIDNSLFPAKLYVDWVRVYQKK